MLKVARIGRQRSDSFSLQEPINPFTHPLLAPHDQNARLIEGDNAKDAQKAADDAILRPTPPQPSNPKQQRRSKDLEKLMAGFHVTDDQLENIEKRMVMEIGWGLGKDTNPSSNIKSYITYVSTLPDGSECGKYLALDLGGTNFRAILVELTPGSHSVKMQVVKHAVTEDLMVGPGEDLFNFMADKLYEFMVDHNLLGTRYSLGFTFSFPVQQHRLDSADLANWTKGFKCEGVVGVDIVKLLNNALDRHKDMEIDVVAVINDTTGCLMACAYKHPDCTLGVIIGTGTNASYVEDISNVDLYEGDPGIQKRVVINTEWGALGNTGSLDFIRTKYDHLVDGNSLNKSQQVYEKLISGMYLGELTRWVLLEAATRNLFLPGQQFTRLQQRDSFPSRYISEIESDEVGDLSSSWNVLEELGLKDVATDFDCLVLRYICECISTRAAVLAAAGVASLLNKMKRPRVTVGMDGSLYKFHPFFQQRMETKIRHLLNPSLQFQLILSEDGSGRGAALAAAVTSKQKQQ